MALAWLLSQDVQVIPIIGSLHPEHLADGLAAVQVTLSAEEVAWLEGGGPG